MPGTSTSRSPRWSSCRPRVLLASLVLEFDSHRGETWLHFSEMRQKGSINCWERLAASAGRYNFDASRRGGKKKCSILLAIKTKARTYRHSREGSEERPPRDPGSELLLLEGSCRGREGGREGKSSDRIMNGMRKTKNNSRRGSFPPWYSWPVFGTLARSDLVHHGRKECWGDFFVARRSLPPSYNIARVDIAISKTPSVFFFFHDYALCYVPGILYCTQYVRVRG